MWDQAAIQPRPSECDQEAAWVPRCWLVHGGAQRRVSGRGSARCIQLSTDKGTDWKHTDSSFNLKNQYIYHLKLWDGFHLELWGGGGCDEGALLLKGMEAEEGEEEDEVGRGEEVLQPSDITWTPSERHTESTQRIQNLETAVFIQYWVKYWIKTKRLKQKIGFWTQNKNL